MAHPFVEIEDLKKHFPVKTGFVRKETKVIHAVDGINFDIRESETFGLVGESGCGKTTLGRLAVRLLEPTAGTVRFEGKDIFKLDLTELRMLRRQMQIVFQDPFASLNPRKTIRSILSQPFRIHQDLEGDEVETKVLELLEQVGLSPSKSFIDRFPHELSGGQRQRIGVARAIALRPRFIVADEPVSALDMSVRAQVLNLINSLQAEYELTYLFISHDLAVVRSVSDRVGVMYVGKVVELGDVEELFNNPLHPYTAALLAATPVPDPKFSRSRERIVLKGDVPSPVDPPSGCRFHPRCYIVIGKCSKIEPELTECAPEHFAACHLAGKLGSGT